MKRISYYLCYVAVLAMVFTSCSKEEDNLVSNDTDKATLSFGAILNDLAKSNNKQSSTDDLPECTDGATAAYVEIALYEGATAVVGTTEDPFRVDLVNGQVFTEEVPELELEPGTYSLEHFMVYDSAGNLLWVAPRGGVLAEFIENPLPLSIELGAGVKKYVDVSVLCYDDRDVVEYGYLFFDIDTNKAIEFCVFGNYCPPSGRHYPAEYSVSVWSGTNASGTALYTNVSNTTGYYDNGDFYADPLCFALPDTEGLDEYYFEITLRSSEEYGDVTERVIRRGVINDNIVRNFFDGEDNLDYYHFREGEGCGDDSTPIFEDPESDTEYYKTCAYPINGSKSVALTYLELDGDILKATVLAAGVTPDMTHPQHIHGLDSGANATCPPASADANNDGYISLVEGLPYYGGVKLALDNEDGTFPMANAAGFYTYQRTFDLNGADFNWENLAVVVHGMYVGEEYVATMPTACGEVANLH
ncbi:MAG: hypothetical protein R3209_05205 [Salinimicrobium sediminis]|uniref:Uncharacterized protein n=1 Tax=Salinimicrobium sediminis TaxID=1343891 RepID=A0A285X4Y3_9FLAO|nr:hypothetical protein [Salinimicrobium sediminis]MDX1602445.1 hypothetical protein [Salinimicrobium sediminis]SOC80375.1 hypothetical protein SAMN06296241_1924 [Salinimicrobium sediminis]